MIKQIECSSSKKKLVNPYPIKFTLSDLMPGQINICRAGLFIDYVCAAQGFMALFISVNGKILKIHMNLDTLNQL